MKPDEKRKLVQERPFRPFLVQVAHEARLLLALLILVVFSPRPLDAASVILTPIADTTLQESFPTNNFRDGTTIQAAGRRYGGCDRALFRLDPSSCVPSDRPVTAA